MYNFSKAKFTAFSGPLVSIGVRSIGRLNSASSKYYFIVDIIVYINLAFLLNDINKLTNSLLYHIAVEERLIFDIPYII